MLRIKISAVLLTAFILVDALCTGWTCIHCIIRAGMDDSWCNDHFDCWNKQLIHRKNRGNMLRSLYAIALMGLIILFSI